MPLTPDNAYGLMKFPGAKCQALVAGKVEFHIEGAINPETNEFTPLVERGGFTTKKPVPDKTTLVDVFSRDVQLDRPDVYAATPIRMRPK